jgi:hypothetical protein
LNFDSGKSVFGGPASCPGSIPQAGCFQVVAQGDNFDRLISCKVTAGSKRRTRGMIANLDTGATSEAE